MEDLVTLILKWHKDNYRIYPWRNESSSYKIMIAEFMLQRTRADQVVPVYIHFINKYPDINSLAEANLSDINLLLKPLGLYWRSSHFKKAAEYIIKEYKGLIPTEKEELLKIPGVGDYVAGAILTVAYLKKTCVIDSNIARVINRFFGLGLTGEIRRKREIKELSCKLFNHPDSRSILFAIIDFSALICTSQNPKHEKCPLNNSCKYYRNILKQSETS